MFDLLVSVVINEVMYNPRGPESSAGLYNEAIEIYNEADSTVCLNGWIIKDRHDADLIVEYPDTAIYRVCPGCVISLCIPPKGFAVILDRDYTNPSSPDPTPYTFPSGTVIMSVNDAQIGNGLSQNDTLYLINPRGDTVDMVGGFPNADDGISVERKSPRIAVFLPSRSPSGHTLGYANSISCPYEYSVYISNVLDFKDSLRVEFIVKNDGTDTTTFKGSIIFDGSKYEDIRLTIPPDSFISFIRTLRVNTPGTHNIGLILDSSDCNSSNDSSFIQYTYQRPTLVINEINYKGTEWIEIFNISEWEINLRNFLICDASSCSDTIKSDLKPQGFLVVSKDTNFKIIFPDVDYIHVRRMPTFNDTRDNVILRSRNFTIDSLYYLSSFGGGYNRSLERVSPYISTNEPTNWGTTQDPRGGTPGRMNSLSFISGKEGIQIPREIFRAGDKIALSFSFDFKVENLKVKIYDDLGRFVKTYEFKPMASVGQVVIDTDDLWKGLYFLVIEVNKSKRFRKRFAISP